MERLGQVGLPHPHSSTWNSRRPAIDLVAIGNSEEGFYGGNPLVQSTLELQMPSLSSTRQLAAQLCFQ
jgi:hypothetical protein